MRTEVRETLQRGTEWAAVSILLAGYALLETCRGSAQGQQQPKKTAKNLVRSAPRSRREHPECPLAV